MPENDDVNDPYEQFNRGTHEFNKSVDRAVLRPVAVTYSNAMPDEVEEIVSNFVRNLSTPGDIVNQVLQGDFENALKNTFRFALNTTMGLGGIADPAGGAGIDGGETDFGETLHVWGVREGAYVELPVLGPSTERAAFGRLVDFFMDPVGNVLGPTEQTYATVVKGADLLSSRGQFAGTIDALLYESADSYAQSRLMYLQNRRFKLGTPDDSEGDYFDPYDDPYAE